MVIQPEYALSSAMFFYMLPKGVKPVTRLLFQYSGGNQKMSQFENVIYFGFDNIFGEDPGRLQVFFAHIFKSIGLILKKLPAKMCFFTFSKIVENTVNTPMTRKIHLPKHCHYEFFSIFRFVFKHSIAIFSAIQNVIWSGIDDFRTF